MGGCWGLEHSALEIGPTKQAMAEKTELWQKEIDSLKN